MSSLTNLPGINRIYTTVYHPDAYGIIKHFNHSLIESLKKPYLLALEHAFNHAMTENSYKTQCTVLQLNFYIAQPYGSYLDSASLINMLRAKILQIISSSLRQT